MYCKKCSERIEKDWSYCPKCGAEIKRIKINLSNTTVLREGTLRSLDDESYTCRDVDMWYHVDCDECMFGGDDMFTLEQIKERLIKEDWLMYNCKSCQYYTWSNKDLEVKCKRGVNIDELYRVNNHRLTRRKCKKHKRKGGVTMNNIIKEKLAKIQDI